MTSKVSLRTDGILALSREAIGKMAPLIRWEEGCVRVFGRPLYPWGWHLCTYYIELIWGCSSHFGVQHQSPPRSPKSRGLYCQWVACAIHNCELLGALASVWTIDTTLENNLSEKESTWKVAQRWAAGSSEAEAVGALICKDILTQLYSHGGQAKWSYHPLITLAWELGTRILMSPRYLLGTCRLLLILVTFRHRLVITFTIGTKKSTNT